MSNKSDVQGRKVFRRLLADLICFEENVIDRIPVDLTKVILPPKMEPEREVVVLLYEAKQAGHGMSPEYIAGALEARGIESPEQIVTTILDEQNSDTITIKKVITDWDVFSSWQARFKRTKALRRALEVTENPEGMTASEEARIVQNELIQVSPTMVRVETVDIMQRHDLWVESQGKLIDRRPGNKGLYPSYPLRELTTALGGLRPGQPCLITGPTGGGKTTIGDVFAEWLAWEEGYYVAYISMETALPDFHRRFMSRHLGIPSRFFLNYNRVEYFDSRPSSISVPPIDPRDPFWEPLLGRDAMQDRINKLNSAGGHIAHSRIIGGPTASFVVELLAQHSRAAEEMGLQMVGIVDYLGKISYQGVEERIGFSQNSAILKDGFDALGAYGIILSQESEGGNPFGSKNAAFVNQVHLRIIRDEATGQEAVTIGGKPLFSAMGEQRFYAHQKGEMSGTKCFLEITKANEGQVGPRCRYNMEGEFFAISDPMNQITHPLMGIRVYDQIDMKQLERHLAKK